MSFNKRRDFGGERKPAPIEELLGENGEDRGEFHLAEQAGAFSGEEKA